jgi:D-alanine-D-alanine ligase-like ATP-grasp enzyme
MGRKIAVIWDDGIHGVLAGIRPDGVARGDVRVTVGAIEEVLRAGGYEVDRIPIDFPISRCMARLEQGYDLVFNLCEGVGDVATGEIAVAAMLDLAQVRYTGSDPLALALALDKARTKEALFARGIPTPRWTAYDAKYYGVQMPKEVPMTTQERAYTSPIWYTPEK